MKAYWILLTAGLLAWPAAAAQTDSEWGRASRELAFTSDTGSFEFTSVDAQGADRMMGAFDADTGRFELDFSSLANGSAMHLETRWVAVLEYRDTDGDGMYGLNDQVVRRVAITSLDGTVVATPLLGGGHKATVSYTIPPPASEDPLSVGGLPTGDGLLHLSFQVVEEPASIDGTPLLPTQVALSTELDDFPFQADDTAVAFEVLMTSMGSPLSGHAQGVQVATATHTESFSLDKQIHSGGVDDKAPLARLATSPHATTLLVSWPRGDDMDQGGMYSVEKTSVASVRDVIPLPPGNAWLYGTGVAAVALAFGLPSLQRLRGS